MPSPDRQEFWASLCLKHTPGIGARTAKKLLEHFGSASLAVEHVRSWRSLGLANSQQQQAFLGETWLGAAQDELDSSVKAGPDVLLWTDVGYPGLLREIPDPPLFLYAIGNHALLDTPAVAVVGSRECSRYGVELASRISRDLSEKGVTVVSGMAHGIDREAHLGGMSGPGQSIAVLGTGPDLVYPASNRDVWRVLAEKGLILSELPPGTKPLAANFPLRNRIISGLSLGVLVVEATTKSGSLITARLAMEQGREVFAVPGPVTLPSYRGCHELINRGARLVHGAEDILLELKPQLEAYLAGIMPPRVSQGPNKRPVQGELLESARQNQRISPAARARDSKGHGSLAAGGLPPCPHPSVQTRMMPRDRQTLPGNDGSEEFSPTQPPHSVATTHAPELPGLETSPLEETVSGHLAGLGATHIDSLCRLFGKDASEMSRTLVVLELKGVVRRLPGGYYLTA